jgi:hypothetical protein
VPSIVMNPVSLPRLLALDVTVSGVYDPVPDESIHYLYEILASSSKSLERLQINTRYSDRFQRHECGKLIDRIVRNHGPTIRSVLLDEITLSPLNLAHLCTKCPNLDTLGFNLPKGINLVSVFIETYDMHSQGRLVDRAVNQSISRELPIYASANS